jgi:hypothetical protein
MGSKQHESLPTGDLVTRLERIEQAIEAVATEVERIAEGQRFTTKLMTEAKPAPALQAPATQNTTPDGTVLSEAARRT